MNEKQSGDSSEDKVEKEKQRLRNRIDELDEVISKALNDRAKSAIEIGHIKQRNGEKLFDPKREEEIFNRLKSTNSGPLTDEALVGIFERIIDESRRVERTTAYKDSKD